jgi:predicted nucleotide-binding protein (sugar kinase/HSP70/actin superfamily)
VIAFELNQEREPLQKTLCRLGCELGATRSAAADAADRAVAEMQGRLARLAAPSPPILLSEKRPPILLIGLPYILHEDYISGPVLSKLHELGVPVRFLSHSLEPVPRTFVAWDTCSKMHHGLDALRPGEVSGVIQISSFNCGCDSMTVEFFRAMLRSKNTPFMVLMLDEHSALAGIETRLEAFVDSMRW